MKYKKTLTFSMVGAAVSSIFFGAFSLVSTSEKDFKTENINKSKFVVGESGVTPVATAGGGHSAYIDRQGSLFLWGQTIMGQSGVQGGLTGPDSYVQTPKRKQHPSGKKFVDVELGAVHTMALDEDGDLFIIGQNQYAQLGNGNTSGATDSNHDFYKVDQKNSSKWVDIAAGSGHSMAMNELGELYAWGDNTAGTIGNGTVNETPEVVEHFSGTLSNPSPAPNPNFLIKSPSKVENSDGSKWSKITAGEASSGAIDENGNLWTWGWNKEGQIGSGETNNSKGTPVKIQNPNGNKWTSLNLGTRNSGAIDDQGKLYTWGSNKYGMLGHGNQTDSQIPKELVNADGATWSSISVGSYHSTAIDSNGSLWAWGKNDWEQIKEFTSAEDSTWDADKDHSYRDTLFYTTPFKISHSEGKKWVSSSSHGFEREVYVSIPFLGDTPGSRGKHSVLMDEDGQVWTLGTNSYHQIGISGSNENSKYGTPQLLFTPPQYGDLVSTRVSGTEADIALSSYTTGTSNGELASSVQNLRLKSTDDSFTSSEIVPTDGSGSVFNLTGLILETNYEFKLQQKVNDIWVDAPVDHVSISTTELKANYGSLVENSVTKTTANIKLDNFVNVEGLTSVTNLKLMDGNGSGIESNDVTIVPNSDIEFTLNGLTENKNYSFKLFEKTRQTTNWTEVSSNSIEIHTDANQPIFGNLTSTNIEMNSGQINLSSFINGGNDRIVSLRMFDSLNNRSSNEITSLKNSLTEVKGFNLTNLLSFTEHSFKLQYKTSANNSWVDSTVDSVLFKTLPKKASFQRVVIENITPKKLKITIKDFFTGEGDYKIEKIRLKLVPNSFGTTPNYLNQSNIYVEIENPKNGDLVFETNVQSGMSYKYTVEVKEDVNSDWKISSEINIQDQEVVSLSSTVVGPSIGIIIGSIMGAAILLALIVSLIIFHAKRREKLGFKRDESITLI